jgi:hypothetical protein
MFVDSGDNSYESDDLIDIITESDQEQLESESENMKVKIFDKI